MFPIQSHIDGVPMLSDFRYSFPCKMAFLQHSPYCPLAEVLLITHSELILNLVNIQRRLLSYDESQPKQIQMGVRCLPTWFGICYLLLTEITSSSSVYIHIFSHCIRWTQKSLRCLLEIPMPLIVLKEFVVVINVYNPRTHIMWQRLGHNGRMEPSVDTKKDWINLSIWNQEIQIVLNIRFKDPY